MSTRLSFSRSALFLLIGGLIGGTGYAQKARNNFVIEGSIEGMPIPPEKVYLIYDTITHKPTDSALVEDGKYTFRGTIDGPMRVTIQQYDYDAQGRRIPPTTTYGMAQFFLDKGTVNVKSTGTLNEAVITGSQAETDYRVANHRMDQWGDSVRKIYKMARETKNTALLNSFLTPENLRKVETFILEDYPAYIRQHPASGANLYLLRILLSADPKVGALEGYDSLFRLLPATTRSGAEGREVEMLFSNELKTALGHKAIGFTQPDKAGQAISLSSFKGKYVLLHFWSSSDALTVAALPGLVKAKEEYGDKGLVVVGISLDSDRNTWEQTIQAKRLDETIQLSDLKGWNNAVAQSYGISTLPSMLLIDPNGTIIATRINSFSLNKTLTSIFE